VSFHSGGETEAEAEARDCARASRPIYRLSRYNIAQTSSRHEADPEADPAV
jgi:hypothetical protein